MDLKIEKYKDKLDKEKSKIIKSREKTLALKRKLKLAEDKQKIKDFDKFQKGLYELHGVHASLDEVLGFLSWQKTKGDYFMSYINNRRKAAEADK